MTPGDPASPLIFYPSYTYKASPTFPKWVKITAKDVHGLLDHRGHDGLKHLFFHLNHPIQYVDLVAPIVAIEPLAANKYALLTIDDGSGCTIGVKITRLLERDPSMMQDDDEEEAEAAAVAVAASATTTATSAVDFPSNTTVANVNIHASLGRFDVEIDDTILDIGTVIRAKCTIGTWFGAKQLDLQRASIVKTTRREVESWRELARFKRDILSKPWFLSENELRRLEDDWKEEQKTETAARTKYEEWRKRREQKERKEEAAYAIMRRQQEAIMNEGALI